MSGNRSYASPTHSGSSATPQNMFFTPFPTPNRSQISDRQAKCDEKLQKISKNNFFQTCPGIVPTHPLRTLRARRHLKTCFPHRFRSLMGHMIGPSSETSDTTKCKNSKKSRKICFSKLVGTVFVHPLRILSDGRHSKHVFHIAEL